MQLMSVIYVIGALYRSKWFYDFLFCCRVQRKLVEQCNAVLTLITVYSET